MTGSILVVDDESAVNDLICDALRLAGYRTTSAAHGMEALRILREAPVDLVVLDINMPNVDGFEVLTRMRDAGDQTPVIILTARQDRDDTKTGFELGADDFVKKPFGIEELTLRVKAVLRRAKGDEPATTLRIGTIELNPEQHSVTSRGDIIELSATEFRLLQVLMEEPNRVLSKAQLLRRVWGLDDGLETTVVETYISYLRKKLGPSLSIRTVRGVGYQLTSDRSTRDTTQP